MLLTDLRLLGLARRAGKLANGREATQVAIKARLVVLAQDASKKVRVHFEVLAAAHKLPVAHVPSKTELGYQLGRGPVAVLAVCDEHFARGIIGKCAAEGAERSASATPQAAGTQGENTPQPRRRPRRGP